MTPEQLADEIVALGIGDFTTESPEGDFYVIWNDRWYSAEAFTHEPRVAMAMLERTITSALGPVTLDHWAMIGAGFLVNGVNNESLPRAINEACAAALREGK